MFAGDNFYPPADGSYANLIWEDLQTREIQNQLFALIDEWGPLFRVSFNLIVHSQLTEAQDTEYPYSSVVTFKESETEGSEYGYRVPAVFYNNLEGSLHFACSINGLANFYFNYAIELKRWYHIEVVQHKENEVGINWLDFIYLAWFQVLYYTVKIDGERIANVPNNVHDFGSLSANQTFQDVKVFVGDDPKPKNPDDFFPPTDGSFSNLIYENLYQ